MSEPGEPSTSAAASTNHDSVTGTSTATATATATATTATTLQPPPVQYDERLFVSAGFQVPPSMPRLPAGAVPFYFSVEPKVPGLTDAELLAAVSFFFSTPKWNARARFASGVQFDVLANTINDLKFTEICCFRKLQPIDKKEGEEEDPIIEVVSIWPEGHDDLMVMLYVYQEASIFGLKADWLPVSIGGAIPQISPFFDALEKEIRTEAVAEPIPFSPLNASETLALITVLQPTEGDEGDEEMNVEGDALQAAAIKSGMVLLKPQNVDNLAVKFSGDVIVDENGFGLYDDSIVGLHTLDIDGSTFTFVGAAAVAEGEAPVFIIQYHNGYGFKLHVPVAGNVFNPITMRPLGHELEDAETETDDAAAAALRFIGEGDLTTVLASEMHNNDAILASIRERFKPRMPGQEEE